MAVFAYIGLGSNLGDRRASLAAALERLRPLRVSRIVETEPWGRTDQGRFLNAVAEIQTDLEPQPLLDRLLQVVRELGRIRGERWGPRTIDLDLLLYDDRVVRTEKLAVPHPRLPDRSLRGWRSSARTGRCPALEGQCASSWRSAHDPRH